MLTDALQCVREFHLGIGASMADTPMLLEADRRQIADVAVSLFDLARMCERSARSRDDLAARIALNLEELAEFIEAHLKGDVTAMLDAVGDRLYVLLGDAVATGTPLERVFAEVHRSNMTKVGAGCSASGKARKAPGYSAPQLDAIERGPA